MSVPNATRNQAGPRALPPFRADHVGSLLRPRELAQARASRKAGTLSVDALRAVEDRSIASAIRRQEELGLRAVTDGSIGALSGTTISSPASMGSSSMSQRKRSCSRAASRYRLRFASAVGSAGANP